MKFHDIKNKNIKKKILSKYESNKPNEINDEDDDDSINNNNDNNINKNNNIYFISSHKKKKTITSSINFDIDNEEEIKSFILDDYKIITQIGQGNFGKIYLVQEKNTGNVFSMKKILLSEELDLEDIMKEYKLCYKLKHKNIVQILGVYKNKLDITTFGIYILMEIGSTDWEKEIKNHCQKNKYYTQKELINILIQLTNALAFLQEKNVSHRDIKPQNVLIFKNNIYKLADFGEAKKISNNHLNSQLNTIRGTELYMSPLLFNGMKTRQLDIKHNLFKSDVYSLGLCILYAANLNNNALYEIRKYVDNNSVKNYIYELLENKYKKNFIELICELLEINEKYRIDFLDLRDKLKNWKN
jgi:serine/threonine protein kinase